MKTWIALLRGVNVGGKNILPMQALRTGLESLGLRKVRTYLQSGNCVFEHDESDPSTLATVIADAIQRDFGFRPEVLVMSRASLKAAITGNPYPEGADDPTSVQLFFLARPAHDADLEVLESVRKPSERFLLADRVFYLHAPEGVGRSKLAARVEKSLGVAVTARNLRSAQQIADLAG